MRSSITAIASVAQASPRRRSGVDQVAAAVVPDPQPPQPLDPAHGPLDHPPGLPEPAAVRRAPPADARLDAQTPRHVPGALAVVAGVRVEPLRVLPRPARPAA